MINRPLSLALSLWLALAPAAPAFAALQESAATPSAGAAAPAAIPSRVLSLIQTVNPAEIHSLANPLNPAEALAAAAVAQSAVFHDEDVKTELARVFGPSGLRQIEEAQTTLSLNLFQNADLSAAAQTLREKRSTIQPDQARAAMLRIIRELGAMREGDAPVAPQASATPASPRRLSLMPFGRPVNGMHGLLAAVMVSAATLLHPASAPAQNAAPVTQAPVAAARAFARAGDVNDLLNQWRPGVHVYAIGNPADDGTLRAIAAAVGDKPWTIVVVETSVGQSYTYQGKSYSDDNAVDFGTGQIANKGGFSDAVDARTGERAGAIFTIVLKNQNGKRTLYFHGSDAMHNHGLAIAGGREFKGDLDQWAIARIKKGGDVVGAVADTVGNVEALLSQSIANETANGQSAVASAKAAVDAFASAKADFTKTHASSTAGSADVSSLRRAVEVGEKALKANKPTEAAKDVAGVAAQANAALTEIQAVQNAEASAKASAAAAAAAQAKLIRLLAMILGALTLGGSLILNFLARRARKAAEANLEDWDKALEAKLDATIDNVDKRMDLYVGTVSGEKSMGWVGKTAELAAQIRQDAGSAKLLMAKARQIHAKATALVRPESFGGKFVNAFWPSNYQAATRMLADEPIEFKADDQMESIFGGQTHTWRGDLYGDLGTFKPFKKTFREVIEEFNSRSKSAVDAIDELEKAFTQGAEIIDGVEATVAAAAKTKDSLANADGLFQAAALYAETLPAAAAQVADARKTAKHDPISGVFGGAAEAKRVADDAAALVNVLVSARGNSLKRVDAAAAAIAALGTGTGWIVSEKERLSAQADAIAALILKSPVGQRPAALTAALETLAGQASDAQKTAQALAERRAALAKTAADVAEARAQIAQTLHVPAEQTLVEKDSNPSDRLAEGSATADKAQAALAAGKIAEANSLIEEIKLSIVAAVSIAGLSLKSLADHPAESVGHQQAIEALRALSHQRETVLNGIKAQFAESTYASIAGNVEAANASVSAADAARAKADEAFKTARLLEAAQLLTQVRSHERNAEGKLNEIASVRAQIDQALAQNASSARTLQSRVAEYETKVAGDSRAMRRTLDFFASAKQQVTSASATVGAPHSDPLQTAGNLAAAARALDGVWSSANADFEAYDSLTGNLDASRRHLDEAQREAGQSLGDGVGASPALRSAAGEVQSLGQAYQAAVAAARQAHGEWPSQDREAARIASAAAGLVSTIRDQFAFAAQAVQTVTSAYYKVEEASNWRGDFGVSVPGAPGSENLGASRAYLSQGDYAAAVRFAQAAQQEAANAIVAAQREVERRRYVAQQTALAAEQIAIASARVSEAANWRGEFDVSVQGNPGADMIIAAQVALGNGDFTTALQYAQQAQQAAANAIYQAQQEVERRRQAAAQREEEAQRKRNNSGSNNGGPIDNSPVNTGEEEAQRGNNQGNTNPPPPNSGNGKTETGEQESGNDKSEF